MNQCDMCNPPSIRNSAGLKYLSFLANEIEKTKYDEKVTLFIEISSPTRLSNRGVFPSSTVNTLQKYSLRAEALVVSSVIMPPVSDLSGPTPVLHDSLRFTK